MLAHAFQMLHTLFQDTTISERYSSEVKWVSVLANMRVVSSVCKGRDDFMVSALSEA